MIINIKPKKISLRAMLAGELNASKTEAPNNKLKA
jgi:hypothetical protein